MSRKIIIASLFLIAPVLSAGCFVEQTESPEGDAVEAADENRGPIGKADLYGQCMEIDMKFCGTKSSGNCYCDEACTDFQDCCSDYEAECTDQPTCDATLICGQAISCVDGQWYPTTCGPANCDAPMGECGDPEPKHCGGFAGFVCDAGEFCSYEQGDYCGFADAMGTCEVKPEVCGEIWSPVCGCDGNNYSNPCEANAAGVSVKQTGDCECQAGYTKQFCWGQSQCVPIGAQC
jgi:hypothetical protein